MKKIKFWQKLSLLLIIIHTIYALIIICAEMWHDFRSIRGYVVESRDAPYTILFLLTDFPTLFIFEYFPNSIKHCIGTGNPLRDCSSIDCLLITYILFIIISGIMYGILGGILGLVIGRTRKD